MKKLHPALIIFFFPLTVQAFKVDSSRELIRLYKAYDRDRDKKITLDDKITPDAVFRLNSTPPITVKGLYQISSLAQELKYSDLKKKTLDTDLVYENPVDRISRSIRDRYWDGLTRRIDASTITEVIYDSKIPSKKSYLYVPHTDEKSYQFYKSLKQNGFEVRKLPGDIPQGYISSLDNEQGLLTLAMENEKGVPYVVPGGRFNEMYGWDSYFHVLGVIHDKRYDLAKGMVDNFVYEINHYGKILNANRTYYLTRSQPPFFTSMIKTVFEAIPKKDLSWLQGCLEAAIKEYKEVWMGKDRLTKTGLSRYAGFDEGIPPEVEAGHFDHVLKPYAKKHGLAVSEVVKKFNAGEIKDKNLIEYFHQDRAVRESGHDTTYRWRVGREDKASDFVTVDLNSLLYRYELDLAYLITKYFKGSIGSVSAKEFSDAAERRKTLIRKYLWNPTKGMFYDYNWKLRKQSDYISATSFYPLWASSGYGEKQNLLTPNEAKSFVDTSLKHLEEAGGLAATAKVSAQMYGDKKEDRQWDYPFGWPPHQIIAWEGLKWFGFRDEAEKLSYKWLYTITKNAADYNGTIPEKFNVVTRSHKVFVEYGNVGTKFSYITLEGFGWMNASYQLGLTNISSKKMKLLRKLTLPEKVFN